MTVANFRATRRHATSWLIALVVAAASLRPGVTGSVHAITEDFYCRADAYAYVLCVPPVVFETATKATTTIQFTNHATGGEVCYIADVNGSQIIGPMWVDEGDPDKKTFAYPTRVERVSSPNSTRSLASVALVEAAEISVWAATSTIATVCITAIPAARSGSQTEAKQDR